MIQFISKGVAFTVAANQNVALIGVDGILPFDRYLKQVKHNLGDACLCHFVPSYNILICRPVAIRCGPFSKSAHIVMVYGLAK